MRNIGMHYSKSMGLSLKEIKERGFNNVQVMVGGGPSLYHVNKYEIENIIKEANKENIHLTLHTPVVNNPSSERAIIRKLTLKNVIETIEYVSAYEKIRPIRIVVHGGNNRNSELEGLSNLEEFCSKVLGYLKLKGIKNVIVCLENLAGAKIRDWNCSSVFNLHRIVSKFASSRIGICLDTNHAWGDCVDSSKYDITSLEHFSKIKKYLYLVHLNSIPIQCRKGQHLDRHSTDYIRECSIGGDKIVDIAKWCEEEEIMCILERSEAKYSFDDLVYIKESW